MNRRAFLQLASSVPAAFGSEQESQPRYRVASRYAPAAKPGMPGPYPGRVISVHARQSIDEQSEAIDAAKVREMIDAGMKSLTGEARPVDAWRRLFSPEDVVGIKVNCSGVPGLVSTPEVVGEITRNLTEAGVKAQNICVYERFMVQLRRVPYAKFLPAGAQILAFEEGRGGILKYDPFTYVEVNFFGEEDSRSNLGRIIAERFTKIINVPNMKDHGASGVTGCLKNIAYGSFSNVARSHHEVRTHTLSFIGTLAMVEPLRSRTVLQIMDGLKGVWHAGPFSVNRRFRYYLKQILFGTDPVAMDRLLLDEIEDKRKAEGAISVWNRSMEYVKPGRGFYKDPNINNFIREPGHVEYASRLGLGVYDKSKIRVEQIEL